MEALPRLDLNQTILRVAVNNAFPFCTFKIVDKGEIILESSIEFNYVKLLMHKFNFNVQLIDMHHQYGIKANGTWSGVIGMIHNGKADFGLCELSPTYERLEVARFSDYTTVDSLGALTCAPKPKQYPFIVVVPFTESVWALICLTIFILSIMQCYNSKDKLSSLIFKLYAIIVRQSINFTSHLFNSRFLYCLWLLLSFVLSSSYVAVFHSLLTLIEYEDPLDTSQAIKKALAKDRVILLTTGYTIFSHLMNTATPNGSTLFYEMRKHHQRNNLKHISNQSEIITTIFRWENVKPFLILAPIGFFKQLVDFFKGYKNLYISQQSFLPASNAMAFPRNSSLLVPFNSVIKIVFENGIIDHWVWQIQNEATMKFKAHPVQYFHSLYDAYLPELANPEPEQMTADVRMLLLDDFKVIFYLLLIGLAISFVIFLFEILSHVIKH